jgi:phosphohistidine phosphatase
MQRLIILRHGDAEKPQAGMGDFARGLTAEGRAEAARAGRLLAEAGAVPDLALVSDARRARETWEAAAAAFPAAEARYDHALYNAAVHTLLAAVEAGLAEGGSVILVGHNPGLHGLAIELAHKDRARHDGAGNVLAVGFPTGAAAVFAFEDGKPRFERLIRGDIGA